MLSFAFRGIRSTFGEFTLASIALQQFNYQNMATMVADKQGVGDKIAPQKQTKEEFTNVFITLRDKILSDKILENQPATGHKWFKEVMDYNVPGGKLNRGMAVLDTLQALKGGEVSDDLKFKANVLGWCIEFLQAFFLVADDIIDHSITRRGQPCWYKQPHVGLIACNDYILLDQCIYKLLRAYFRDETYYVQLVDLFHETTFKTAHGQMLDVITAPIGKVDLSKYTIDTYLRIVTYKTAYYSFCLPAQCGLILAGAMTEESDNTTCDIMVQMGQYFQIQDDYLDCYGNPETIGKIGTDIQDNKCSWLICKALTKANEEQKQIIEVNYGKDVPESIEAVKQVYRQLNVADDFQKYEQESYQDLQNKIQQQTQVPPQIFNAMLAKIYKRQK